jgi:hypothetical protein
MVLKDEIKKYLENIYYNHKNHTSFSNEDDLYKYIRSEGRYHISRETLKNWLLEQEVYTTHVGKHRPKHWSRIIVPSADYMIEMDSAFLNSGDKITKFVIGINAFTKKLQAIPVANLKAETVSKAIEKILNDLGTPMKVRVDRGREFVNATANALFKQKKIDVVYSYPPRKSQFVERAIRSLKKMLYKVMQHKGSKKWSHLLPQVVKNYNNRIHRTTNKAPVTVTQKDESEIWFKKKHDSFNKEPMPSNFKFRLGDSVRLKVAKELYSKDFDEKFSTQVYYIASRLSPQNIHRYKVKNYANELLVPTYSENELLKVHVNELTKFRVEKELARKKIGGVPHILIKWLGYSKQFNSWIPASELNDLK